jgi:hypothetical protein
MNKFFSFLICRRLLIVNYYLNLGQKRGNVKSCQEQVMNHTTVQ